MFNLTKGSLKQILDGNQIADPVMQILTIKQIQNTSVDVTTRYKITLYDGDMQHTFGILATQKNHTIENEELKIGSVIKLTEYAANVLSKEPQKVVIILMNFTILGEMDIKTSSLSSSSSSSSNSNDTKKQPIGNNENQEPLKKQQSITSPTKPVQSTGSTINSNKFFNKSEATASNKSQNKLQSPILTNKNNISLNTSASSSAGGGNLFHGLKVFSISSLNPYQNKWAIKARVTNKSNIRNWSNSKGEGKLFSCDLIDQSGEIRATGFNDTCDRYYDMLQIDHVYLIAKATLKTANRQYTTIDNDYEMTFNNETIIEPCDEECDNSIPRINLNPIPLSELLKKNPNDIVDIIGIVKSAGDVVTITAKQSGKELKKRDVHLVDNSNCAVTCTLWGKTAEDFDASDNPIMLIKGAKVSDYNGRTIGALASSTIQINPDIAEAHTLKGWFDQGGCNGDIHDLSTSNTSSMIGGGSGGASSSTNWKCLEQVKDEQLGMGDKADYFTTTSTITYSKKENAMYMACATEGCNKKVIDQNNGHYRCEKCGKDFDKFKWRMILQLNIADYSDSQWITCFQETAETILGVKTDELGDLKATNNPNYDEVFSNCVFKEFSFKCRAKMETYNDERRVKLSVVSVDPVDYIAGGKSLLQKIKIYANSQQ